MKNNTSRKSVKANMVLNLVKNLCTIVFPLITFPYVSRVLGSESIGKVQYTASIVSYFALFASLGLDSYAIREGARLRDKKSELEKLASELFTINTILNIIAYAGIIIMLVFMVPSAEYRNLIIIQSLTIAFTTIGAEWLNVIFEDFKFITIRTIIFQVLTLLLSFVLIKNTESFYEYAFVSVISTVGVGVSNYIYLRKKIKLHFTRNIHFKKHIIPMLVLFSTTLATTLYKNSDITMLGILANETIVGVYYLGVKIYELSKRMINSITQVAIPRVSYYLMNGRGGEKQELLNKVFRIIILSVLPAIAILVILRKQIVMIVGGSEYLASIPSFSVLAFSLIFATLANFYSNLVLITHRKEKISFIATLTAAVLNIVLNLIFIPLWGEVGAAITTLSAEFVVVLITGIYSRRYYVPKGMQPTFIIAAIGCAIIVCSDRLVAALDFGDILHVAVVGAISAILYGSILLWYGKKNTKLKKYKKEEKGQ